MPSAFGDILRYDDFPVPDLEQVPQGGPFTEMGSTGLKRAAGFVDEEFLPALRGRKAIKVFREMSLNDPIVGSLLFAIDKLLRQVSWRVEAVDNTPEQTQAADFLESCMEDMSHTWDDLISEVLSCLIYGWSWHEIVYKRRIGPWERDPKKKSRYSDGLIGWRKMPIRSQETMQRWIFDDEGGIKGMVQLAPPHYRTVVLPIEKSLLFRTGVSKGNPEGISLLRNAYRPWFFKKRLEEFEAIGVERDLAGMPVAKVPSSYMNARKGTKEYQVYQSFKRMVQNVRRDEHEGLVLPLEYDPETKQALFEFDLMSSGGARQFDTSRIIERYEQRILMTVLADFIMIGHQQVGSYALHVDKTGIFRAALNSICEAIADTFNRHAIPRLFELNGWRLEELPRLKPNHVDPPDLAQLSQFMQAMGGLGMQWFPDPELEKFLRETAHLPELPDEMLEMRRQMAMQGAVMQYAEQQMGFLGMQQKAALTQQGYSPEQAMMLSESPTPEMTEQELVAQAEGHMRARENPAVQQEEAEQQEMMAAEQQAQNGNLGQQVEAKGAEASIEEERAERDHKRTLEASEKQTRQQIMLERLKQQGQRQASKDKIREAKAKPKPQPGGGQARKKPKRP